MVARDVDDFADVAGNNELVACVVDRRGKELAAADVVGRHDKELAAADECELAGNLADDKRLAAANGLLFLVPHGNVVVACNTELAESDALLLAILLYGPAGAVVLDNPFDDSQVRKCLIEFLLATSSSVDPFVDVRKLSDKSTKSLIV